MVPRLPTRFLVSRGTLDTLSLFVFRAGLSPSLARLSQFVLVTLGITYRSHPTLQCTHHSLGSSFYSRYSGNRCFFLFLRVLRCFSSPGSLPRHMNWRMIASLLKWVSPFRNLRIKGYFPPRSLSCLSSFIGS